MRGGEQHVDRRIRLWVVQQERIRLLGAAPDTGVRAREGAKAAPPGPAGGPPSDPPSRAGS